MKVVVPAVLVASALLLACSSDSTPAPAGGGQDQGVGGDGVGAANTAPDTNPQGAAYPNTNFGFQVGSTIKNFKFLGFPNANVAGGLQPISLAEYFDPSATEYKMIHIQAAGSWCTACRGETTALVPLAAQLQAKKVLWLVSLAEGPTPGVASTKTDLQKWISDFNSPFTHVLDPNNANLGPFYDRSALPWNSNINAKTMVVLTSGTGGAQSGDQILQDIDDALAMIK
jgi:hypothetical protein